MSELTKDLVPHLAAHWKQFAHITDTPQHIIDTVHADYVQLGVERCCTEFFTVWLRRNPDATWNGVITAVTDIGLREVAENLTSKYLN